MTEKFNQHVSKNNLKIKSENKQVITSGNGACLFTVMLCNGDYFYPVVRQADE
jgi:hypothetical protein